MASHSASALLRISCSLACLLVAPTVMAQSTDHVPTGADAQSQGANTAPVAPPSGQAYPPAPGAYPPTPGAYPPANPPAPRSYPPPQARPASIEPVERPGFAESETGKPRTLAIGLTMVKEHGFGAVVRGRANHVAVDLAAGFNPLLVIITGDESKIDFGMPLQASLGPVFFISNDQANFQNGIRVNGIYNRALGPGGGVGWVGEITKRRFTIAFGAGLQIFPQATRRVKEYFSDLQDASLTSSAPEVQFYFGVNLLWYLL